MTTATQTNHIEALTNAMNEALAGTDMYAKAWKDRRVYINNAPQTFGKNPYFTVAKPHQPAPEGDKLFYDGIDFHAYSETEAIIARYIDDYMAR
jgi:hypothetical protein